ncbi:uncharacterized protein BJ171DRAFT_218601 [Polychytrium aggregatum]|uniref:uncharacterized protein n=1 Tax=Polychytrium aggregatum TaxID=110093 RepID=UPI0022FDCCAE|nr:uncharacterized protein BJ171DRAFT_218601 [Polychytrium aggregatum]KAI9199228.1 hypothetical protein BJ171DRAFT_218601 [Polychytrium aggregatum]
MYPRIQQNQDQAYSSLTSLYPRIQNLDQYLIGNVLREYKEFHRTDILKMERIFINGQSRYLAQSTPRRGVFDPIAQNLGRILRLPPGRSLESIGHHIRSLDERTSQMESLVLLFRERDQRLLDHARAVQRKSGNPDVALRSIGSFLERQIQMLSGERSALSPCSPALRLDDDIRIVMQSVLGLLICMECINIAVDAHEHGRFDTCGALQCRLPQRPRQPLSRQDHPAAESHLCPSRRIALAVLPNHGAG